MDFVNNKAIEFYTKHLNISRELGNRTAEGNAYCGLGNAFSSLGQTDKAIDRVVHEAAQHFP